MKQAIPRRLFLKYCAAGGAALLADPCGWTGSLRAQTQPAPVGWQAMFPKGKTRCGLFNIPSLEIGKDMGAQGTRLGMTMTSRTDKKGVAKDGLDVDIPAARNGKFSPRLQLVKDLSAAGIPVIATFSWISNSEKGKKKLPAKGSADWQKGIEIAQSFVEVMSPHLLGVTLENEPFLSYPVSDFASKGAGLPTAIEWFQELAAAVRKAAPQLLISTPALIAPKGQKSKGLERFFGWAEKDSNIDVIDVHCHVSSPNEADEVLNYTRKQFSRGIIITEWSEAGRFRSMGDKKISEAFATKWKRSPTLSNSGYITQCEANPVDGPGDSRVGLEEWNEFVATFPIDPDFMMKTFEVFKKHGVLVANYGAAIQYGSAHFDMKQLYANMSVVPGPDGKPQPNYKFPEWFKAMAAANPLT